VVFCVLYTHWSCMQETHCRPG